MDCGLWTAGRILPRRHGSCAGLGDVSAAAVSKHNLVSIAHPGFEPSTSSTLVSLDAVHWSSPLTPLL